MDLWKRNGTLNGLCPKCFGSFKHLQIRFLTYSTFNNNLLSSNWLTWWLYQVNSQCDGDRDSYDAMILLTGRFDYHDVRPGLKIFLFSFGARPWGWWWYLILGWVQGVIILSVDIANLRLLTGSESYWGNLAAHKFEFQTLVDPRGNKFMAICSEVWSVFWRKW